MKSVIIAQNTFTELIRKRFYSVILFVAFTFFVMSFLLGAMSIDEQIQILTHLGLGGIQLSSLAIVLFMGAQLIPNEIEKQTCLIILTRPISRGQFYVGKFVGFLFTLFLTIFSLGFVLYFLLGLTLKFLNYLVALSGIFLESSIILSIVMMGSLFLRPMVATLLGLGIFIFGNWLPELNFFAEKSQNDVFIGFSKVMNFMTPNLFELNFRSFYLLQQEQMSQNLPLIGFHSLMWIFFLMVMGIQFFRRKDLVQFAG